MSVTMAYRVHNAGCCGEGTAEMVDRLPEELGRLSDAGIRPVLVLLLGGTNDLDLTPFLVGLRKHPTVPAEHILANLRQLRKIASEASAVPVAMAIPVAEFGASGRDEVNSELHKEIMAENNSLFVDLSSVSKEHLRDGIHFKKEGYTAIAHLVFEQIKERLAELSDGIVRQTSA
eukprot:gnl/TRDRNA2_/TRDRNA2_78845_c0_seq1.p1 gnl/TRDRNA2_/TRDRNA2_78845_c0~~gnl/TRDRNA2_/TRDRNA2_78845_c0_seq1.p1  ORF type:complete len:190 (+),score=38.37 gnl/TRDRNA2_/TRDRNA2_78845_c0_seq1:46-570(+)